MEQIAEPWRQRAPRVLYLWRSLAADGGISAGEGEAHDQDGEILPRSADADEEPTPHHSGDQRWGYRPCAGPLEPSTKR